MQALRTLFESANQTLRWILGGLVFLIGTPSLAIDTGIDGLTLNGRLKQGTSVMYDLEDGRRTGPENFLAEIKAAWRPMRNLTFVGNFWYRGDWAPIRGNIVEETGGLKNPLTPPPFDSAPFLIYEDDCTFSEGVFCADGRGMRRFADFDDEVIRELSLKFRDPKRRYTIKVGKFQRGWGQSDGLRLMDILHAQDLR